MSDRIKGSVKWFNAQKGYGFISRTDKKGDVFVHHTGITEGQGFKELVEGEMVEFETAPGPKGDKAVNVRRV